MTYGLRGLSYYKISVAGPARDLHSGVFGRMVHEPMTDLIAIMSKLVDPSGRILIPGIEEMVEPATDEERFVFNIAMLQDGVLILIPDRQIYESLDYSIADIEESAGASISVSSDKATVLMGRMRYPSLSLHGIEGAFSGVGAKTVIPAKVGGKFSVRFVHSFPLRLVTLLIVGGKTRAPSDARNGRPTGEGIH